MTPAESLLGMSCFATLGPVHERHENCCGQLHTGQHCAAASPACSGLVLHVGESWRCEVHARPRQMALGEVAA